MRDGSATTRHPGASPNGFTLVELAIVLVIIGLIVGGVLVGRDLIRQAELRSQIAQMQQYDAAYTTFRLKYYCLPGDCSSATQYFPTLTNGNGNGYIENNMATYYDGAGISWAASSEYSNFFVELGMAGLIAFKSDGSTTIGKGLPPLKYSNATSTFFASDTRSFQVLNPGTSRVPDIAALRHGSNALWFVACDLNTVPDNPASWDNACGVFLGADLQHMDEKADDGFPLSGKIYGFGGANSGNSCLTAGNTKYDVLRTTRECQAAYIID